MLLQVIKKTHKTKTNDNDDNKDNEVDEVSYDDGHPLMDTLYRAF